MQSESRARPWAMLGRSSRRPNTGWPGQCVAAARAFASATVRSRIQAAAMALAADRLDPAREHPKRAGRRAHQDDEDPGTKAVTGVPNWDFAHPVRHMRTTG